MGVKEKLMEFIREAPYNIFGNKLSDCYFDSCLELIADHLIANDVTVTQWISVDDRLPDETGRYLVVKKRIAPDEFGGNRTDIVILRFLVGDGFRMPTHIPDWINEEINEEVTHWMPLPQLPKGE